MDNPQVQLTADAIPQEVQSVTQTANKPIIFGVIITMVMFLGAMVIFFLTSGGLKSEWPELNVSLDDNSTVSTIIDQNGGVLEISSTDQPNITLTIPEDSMVVETSVTMTAITSLGVESLDEGFITGVNLTPDGTGLINGGTLTISIPVDIDTSNLKVLAYEGNGTDARYYPFQLEGNVITIEISGFSGYAVGTSTERYDSSSESSAAEQNISDLAQDDEISDEAMDEVENILRDWYKNEIKPNLESATNDSTLIKSAVKQYHRWLILVQKFGFEGALSTEITEAEALVAKGIANAIDDAYNKCILNHDLEEIGEMIYWAKYAQLLGKDTAIELDIDTVINKVRNCTTFELTFESTLTDVTDGDTGTKTYTTGSTLLQLNSDLSAFIGTGMHTQQDFRHDGASCPGNPVPQKAFTILDGMIDASGLSLDIQLETYEESYMIHKHVCNLENNFTFIYEGPDFWIMDFETMHEDEFMHTEIFNAAMEQLLETGSEPIGDEYTQLGLDYTITNWDILGSELYATKTYARTIDTIKENTVFELHHKPVR